MTPILSTRSLSEIQMTMLKDAGISIEVFDAITINHLDADLPTEYNHFIFTSKNGVKGFLRNRKKNSSLSSDTVCYCVGGKTAIFLEENGLKVAKMAENASELGNFIAKQTKKGPFLVFTGNRNRPELNEIFRENGVLFREIKVYETHLNSRKFDRNYNCVLFYSPSGIQSFLMENSAGNSLAICIGETTAKEARKNFKKVFVADRPSTEAVLQKLIEIYPTIAIS